MDVPTSYFGNVDVATAIAPSRFNAAAATVAPISDATSKPRSKGVNVALYIGLGFAITMVLVAAWWWTRASLENENPNTPEALELEDFRRRIEAINSHDHRADMEEWLRLCRGSSRPTVHAILIEVLRSNLGPSAGGTEPPAAPTLAAAEAPRPEPAPPSHKMVAPAPENDQLFAQFR